MAMGYNPGMSDEPKSYGEARERLARQGPSGEWVDPTAEADRRPLPIADGLVLEVGPGDTVSPFLPTQEPDPSPGDEDERRAYEQGVQAALSGGSEGDNPYPASGHERETTRDDELRYRWWSGFTDAERPGRDRVVAVEPLP
jgi:hypothetical protein